MKPVKNTYVVIQWVDGRWKPVTKKTDKFLEHLEEFNDLNDTAHLHEPPHHYKSIHTCWLDDIANWEGPYDRDIVPCPPSLQAMMSPIMRAASHDLIAYGRTDIDAAIADLTANDKKELRKFRKYLVARQRYGDAVLLKRPFWRRYLGL